MADILVAEAAKILKVSGNFVRYLENTGQLPCRRIGQLRVFNSEDVEALARRRYEFQTGQVTHWRRAAESGT